MREKIHIAVCPDKSYVMPTGVMMCSVCVNNPDLDIQFHIITDTDVTERDCDDLMAVVAPYNRVSIRFYRVAEQVLGNPFPRVGNLITRAAYFRLYLTDILPSSIDKVLYLDGDLIVRRSLTELWNTDLSGCAIAAVPDKCMGTTDRYEGLGYPKSLGYFNSGVLLINLAYWRQHQATKLFAEFLRDKGETIRYHDQDVLNYVFREQKVMLPIKYNFQHGFLKNKPEYDEVVYGEEVKEARKDPIIVHFTGDRLGEKPWRYSYDPHPFLSTFLKYQKMTKWKGDFIDWRPYSTRARNVVGNILRRMRILPKLQSRFINIAPVD